MRETQNSDYYIFLDFSNHSDLKLAAVQQNHEARVKANTLTTLDQEEAAEWEDGFQS